MCVSMMQKQMAKGYLDVADLTSDFSQRQYHMVREKQQADTSLKSFFPFDSGHALRWKHRWLRDEIESSARLTKVAIRNNKEKSNV